MKGTYWQKGEALDYRNNTDKKIENGEVVVLGNRIGVAGDDILPGENGVVHVSGVFGFDKTDTTEISIGTEVYLTEEGITASEGSTKAGYAAADSSESDTKVYVKINA